MTLTPVDAGAGWRGKEGCPMSALTKQGNIFLSFHLFGAYAAYIKVQQQKGNLNISNYRFT